MSEGEEVVEFGLGCLVILFFLGLVGLVVRFVVWCWAGVF